MSPPAKPSANGGSPTTTIDFDLSNLEPVTLDPRNQMAERLLFRGHASLNEILAVSFGEWPPKGLNIMGGNDQRVNFVSLSELFNTTDEKILLDKGRDALGFADAGHKRQIWVSDQARGTGNSAHMLASIIGHEGAHILQFDHQSRAPSAFGGVIGDRMAASYSKPVSNLLADSVFGRHTDEARLQSSQKPFEGKKYGIDYFRDGVEIQARIHEVLVEGYPKWGQMPQNREQFLVAMQSAGVKLTPSTRNELMASPNYEEAKRVFGTPAPTRAADEINIARSTLTDAGKFSFENDALTRMYADLIEMYGDREGRARFGYGTNEIAHARDLKANTRVNPNGVMDIPDFKAIMGENAMFVAARNMDAQTYAKVKEGFKAGGIQFIDTVSATHGAGMFVGIEEFHKIATQRIIAREPIIKLPGVDRAATPELALSQNELLKTNKGHDFVSIGRKPESEQIMLREAYDKAGIKYKAVQPAYNGGVLALEIDPQSVGKAKALHAEAQLDRPLFLDPAKPEYRAQVQQAQNQRQLHDLGNPEGRQAAMRAVMPPTTPAQQREILAKAELINTEGKGTYVSIEGRSPQERKALTDALDAAGVKFTERRSSIDGGKQVLAIDPAGAERLVALHRSVKTDHYNLAGKSVPLQVEAQMAMAGERAREQLATPSHKATWNTQMQTLGGSEIIHTANKGDYISLEGKSPQDKKILTEMLDAAGIKYSEKRSSVDGGKQVLAIDAEGTAKFRNLHAEALKTTTAIAAGAAAATIETARAGRAAAAAAAMPNVGTGVGIAMGVYGLTQKFGENGTAAKDLKDERTATLAKVGIAADATAIAADSTELLVRASRGMATAAKVGRIAAPVGMALSVASGAIDYKIAEKQGDGKRAAAAIGGTTGGMAGALAGGVAGAKVGAAIGAAVGVWFGGVGAGPGAVIGGAVFGVAGALGLGWAGAESGKKVAEATLEKPLQKKFDEDKKAEMAAAAKPAAAPAPVAAPKTQVAANQPAYNEPSSKYAHRLDAPSTEKFAASAPALGKEFARASSETATAAPKPAVNDPVYKTAAVKPVAIPVV